MNSDIRQSPIKGYKLLMDLLTANKRDVWKIANGILTSVQASQGKGGQAPRPRPLIRKGSYSFYQGSSPYLLVAHVDTVAKAGTKAAPVLDGIFLRNGNADASPERPAVSTAWGGAAVLGADDRAGVFAILRICSELAPNGILPSVLLTDLEEVGGIGAQWFAEDNPDIFESFRLVLELDRRGDHDFVNYAEDSRAAPELERFLNRYGFEEADGSFSDISHFERLAPKVPMVNLSVGYRHEHTSLETLNLLSLDYTIKRVCAMLREAPPLWPNLPGRYSSSIFYRHGWRSGASYKGADGKLVLEGASTYPSGGGFASDIDDDAFQGEYSECPDCFYWHSQMCEACSNGDLYDQL